MAEYGEMRTETFKAAADLRNCLYHIMRFVGAGAGANPPTTNIASNAAALKAVGVIGVLQNAPNTNEHASIAFLGRSKVVGGGTVTGGQYVTTNGSGRAVNAASGDLTIGVALQTAVTDGEIISVLLQPPFRLFGL
jgi:hypothetical protein